ncbi:MAG: MMPL family transporter [Phycisphaerales bacterium]
MTHDHTPLRHRIIDALAAWITARPIAVVVGALLMAGALAAWSWDRVKLDANTDSLMGTDRPYVAEYMRFLKEFGDLEYAWIVVDARGTDGQAHLGQAQRAVDLLAARLREDPTIEAVHASVSFPEQMRLGTWHMPTADLKGLVEGRDALGLLASDAGPGVVLADAQRRLGKLFLGGAFMPRDEAERVGAAAVLELEAIASAAPGSPEFIGTPRETEYLPSASGNLLFVGVMPRKDFSSFEVIDQPLARIRAAIAQVQAEVPEVEIGLTGKPVLQSDEMATTNNDMNIASIAGLVLCAALFMAVFRGVKLPMLALVAFMVGCALTYAAAAILYGRLNLLSIVFMLVLVGVGLDYGIHMVARYLEARRVLPVGEAIAHMMRTAVPSNLAGALTSAGVFLLAWFTEFQGLRELGVVSGIGLLLTLGAIVVVLPALLVIFDGRLARGGRDLRPMDRPRHFFGEEDGRDRAIRLPQAWTAVAVSAALAIAAGWYGLTHLRFESNLLKLQAAGLSSVEWEHRVIDESAAASWFGASVVGSMKDIPERVAQLRAHPEVGEVRSVLDAVELETPERAALRAQFASAVEAAPTRPRKSPEWGPEQLREAGDDLIGLARYAQREAPEAAGHMRDIGERLRTLALLVDPRHHSIDAVARMRAQVEVTLERVKSGLHQMAEGARLPLREALPEAVRAQMVSPGGRFLVMIHPAEDVWDAAPLERFVTAMREVDPHATGVPMTVSESTKSMMRSFAQQAVLATVMVIVLLLLDLRSVRETVAAMLSLAMGVAWTIGAMAACGATFNLANFFAVPIMIGLGIDSAIHITHRAHEGALDHGFGATRRAVIVTALTTTIGFGALLVAHHQGLRSLGIAMGIGSVFCLISAVWTLPALLRVIGLRPRHAALRLVVPEEAAPGGKAAATRRASGEDAA